MHKDDHKHVHAALRKLDPQLSPSKDAIAFARELGISGTDEQVTEQIRSLTKVAHSSDADEFGAFMESQHLSRRPSRDAARTAVDTGYKGWWLEKADKRVNEGGC